MRDLDTEGGNHLIPIRSPQFARCRRRRRPGFVASFSLLLPTGFFAAAASSSHPKRSPSSTTSILRDNTYDDENDTLSLFEFSEDEDERVLAAMDRLESFSRSEESSYLDYLSAYDDNYNQISTASGDSDLEQRNQETETVRIASPPRRVSSKPDGRAREEAPSRTATSPKPVSDDSTLSPIASKSLTSKQKNAVRRIYNTTTLGSSSATLSKITTNTKTNRHSTRPPSPRASKEGDAASFPTLWVRRFLATCPRDVLLPVPADFLRDNFNLAQLAPVVEGIVKKHYPEASATLRASSTAAATPTTLTPASTKRAYPIFRQAHALLVDTVDIKDTVPIPPHVLHFAAKVLYILIHQRYALSPRGMEMVRRRFLLVKEEQQQANEAGGGTTIAVDAIFSRCPSPSCRGTPLLPCGDSAHYTCAPFQDSNNNHTTTMKRWDDGRVKRYCPCCGKSYVHWESRIDGSAWGPSWPHLFMLSCGKDVYGAAATKVFQWNKQQASLHKPHLQQPRIFGFALHPTAQPSSTHWP